MKNSNKRRWKINVLNTMFIVAMFLFVSCSSFDSLFESSTSRIIIEIPSDDEEIDFASEEDDYLLYWWMIRQFGYLEERDSEIKEAGKKCQKIEENIVLAHTMQDVKLEHLSGVRIYNAVYRLVEFNSEYYKQLKNESLQEARVVPNVFFNSSYPFEISWFDGEYDASPEVKLERKIFEQLILSGLVLSAEIDDIEKIQFACESLTPFFGNKVRIHLFELEVFVKRYNRAVLNFLEESSVRHFNFKLKRLEFFKKIAVNFQNGGAYENV